MSNKVLSVVELIKNSYDADATKVIIILSNMVRKRNRREGRGGGVEMLVLVVGFVLAIHL